MYLTPLTPDIRASPHTNDLDLQDVADFCTTLIGRVIALPRKGPHTKSPYHGIDVLIYDRLRTYRRTILPQPCNVFVTYPPLDLR
jgi:hypothetical protein